jgi:hypothetical protein
MNRSPELLLITKYIPLNLPALSPPRQAREMRCWLTKRGNRRRMPVVKLPLVSKVRRLIRMHQRTGSRFSSVRFVQVLRDTGLCAFGAHFGIQNHPNVDIVAIADLLPSRCSGLAMACGSKQTGPSCEKIIKATSAGSRVICNIAYTGSELESGTIRVGRSRVSSRYRMPRHFRTALGADLR